jgi:hypothetical protein
MRLMRGVPQRKKITPGEDLASSPTGVIGRSYLWARAFIIDQSRPMSCPVRPKFRVASNQHTTKGKEQRRECYPHTPLLPFR